MNKSKSRVLHQHLIKCGGTTLNTFLASKFPANRVLDPATLRFWQDAVYDGLIEKGMSASGINKNNLARFRIRQYDCVSGHTPLFWEAADDFFTITVLRDPIRRVFSQISDWKRLNSSDINRGWQEDRKFKEYAKDANYKDIMENWDAAPIARKNLTNMQTRLLGISYLGPGSDPGNWSTRRTLEIAKEAIQSYDLVGVTEDLDSLARGLSETMGWCPPRTLFSMNVVGGGKEVPEAFNSIAYDLNRNDMVLYEMAKEMAEKRCSEYNTDIFEEKYAEDRVKVLSPVFVGDREFRFDFNMSIVGNGFWPRDAGNTGECAVWTGPDTTTTLFFPIAPHARATIQLGVKGYVNHNIRENLKLYVDGKHVEFRYAERYGLEDLIEFDYISKRFFIRIDIISPETVSSDNDERERGVSLLNYGYRL